MKLYSNNEEYKLFNGNMIEMLNEIQENSIDCIITDPPYELNFMNKDWDNMGVSFNKKTWETCLKVLKPGGYLLVFGGSRTYHRIACAIEDAGFEIRDTIMWLYGSGFPKSMNIGLAIDKKNGVESEVIGTQTKKSSPLPNNHDGSWADNQEDGTFEIKKATNEWKGWGTCLKPAFEPIIVARKLFKRSCVDNVIKYGVGGINIDECRVETNGEQVDIHHTKCASMFNQGEYRELDRFNSLQGRFPANVILDDNNSDNEKWRRYFYCAKASKKDRDEGLEEFNNAFQRGETLRKNTHLTVKPTELMQYLVRLVAPENATILDPFNGSGSTGKAVMYENIERNKNYKYIGIELQEEYLQISKARIEYICNLKSKEIQYKLN